jgi:hypothetical protein
MARKKDIVDWAFEEAGRRYPKKAEKLFADFHGYEPEEISQFPDSFFIPEYAAFAGPAMYVLYLSAKCDPVTMKKPTKPVNYIHEHEEGVKVYIVDSDEGPERKVPKYIHSADALTFLGVCTGFGYSEEDGSEVEATCTKNVGLYAIPSGKGLLVIEGKRKVAALIWGGKLNVEPRGIVG